MKLKILFSLLAVVAVGCSKDSASKEAPLEISPAFRKEVQSAKPVTPELHEQAKAALKPASTKLPGLELIVGALDTDEIAKEMGELDEEGKATLARIEKDCKAVKGEERQVHSEGSGVGSVNSTSQEHSVSGDNCPVAMKETTVKTTKLVSVDAKKRTGSVEMQMDSDSTSKVIDAELKKKTNVDHLIVSSNAKIKMVDISAEQGEGKLISGLARFEGASRGEYRLADGTSIPVRMQMQGFRTPSTTELAMITTISLPKGDLQISLFKSGDKIETFVNGQPATREEIFADYGFDPEQDIEKL